MEAETGAGGLTFLARSFASGVGRDFAIALQRLLKADVRRAQSFVSFDWLPYVTKGILKIRFIVLILVVFGSPLRPKAPAKYLIYRGWLLRIGFLFLSASAGLAALSTFARLTLPHYWRLWALGVAGLFTVNMLQPAPKARLETLKAMHDKVAAAAGDTGLRDCHTRSHDGVDIHYQQIGHGNKVILLCNGAGGRIHVWEPLLRALRDEGMYDSERFTVVTWDYRGLFQSGAPTNDARLSIRDIASDINAVLDSVGKERVHTLIGWSMGVQVGLEFTALHPNKVEHLVLLNGSHGNIMDSALQPVFRIPWLGGAYGDFLAYLKDNAPWLGPSLRKMVLSSEGFLRIVFRNGANADMEWLQWEWLRDIFDVSKVHTHSFIVQFQELNAHSVYHHLPNMEQRALIITGMLDPLTPAYQSYELRQQLRNSKLEVYMTSTHFTLMEHAEEVAHSIRNFICENEHSQQETVHR